MVRVRRLWGLSYSDIPEPVSAREFKRLAAYARDVRAALADGTLELSLSRPS